MKLFPCCFTKRIGIILFWLSVIVIFLFSPQVLNLFRESKSLTIFTWPLVLNSRVVAEFERRTGIKLYVNYYETNEELYSKLKQTDGVGYDIVVPTDYAVAMLIKDGLLKKLDISKLDFFDRLDPRVLHHYFDPDNAYSLPYFWGVYGLGVNTKYFEGKTPNPTWGLLFDKSLVVAPIAMTDAPREAIMLAAQYLFGTTESLKDPQKLQEVKKLLLKQKEWVQLYSEARAEDLLLSDSCPIVAALSTDVWKVKKEEGADHISFIRPEKSFVFIDSFVVPKHSGKDDLIYEFLNFMYRPKVIKHHMSLYGSCSPVVDVTSDAPSVYCPDADDFNNLMFFKDIIPLNVIDDIWITLMAD